MKNFVSNLKWIPEFYFILVSLVWFHISVQNQDPNVQSMVNFPAVILIVIFHIQLFLNDTILGKILAAVTILASFGVVVKFFGRFMSMEVFTQTELLFTLKLSSLVVLNCIMAYLMYKKYNTIKASEITD